MHVFVPYIRGVKQPRGTSGSLYLLANRLVLNKLNGKSGIRESNPPPRLGKPVHYRCANSAIRKNEGERLNCLGADTRTRTEDLRITNALLYQLSHIGNCDAKVVLSRETTKCSALYFSKKITLSPPVHTVHPPTSISLGAHSPVSDAAQPLYINAVPLLK